MKIKILKRIIISGKIANVGDVVDSASIPARDCAFLIKAKLAEKIVEKKSVETADAKPAVETADAAPAVETADAAPAVETADAAPKSKRGKSK